MADETQSPEELQEEREQTQRAKISMPEGILLVMFSGAADAAEVFCGLSLGIPVFGQVCWFGSFMFGIFVSAVLILWSLLRSVHGRFVVKIVVKRKLIPLLVGTIFDALTLGIMPIRTIVLVIVIWLNNHFEEKNLERILGLLEKASA